MAELLCNAKKAAWATFSCHLGGSQLLQGEADHLLPSHWLPETHWSGRWIQNLYLLWEAYGHRSCCWCSGWRMEGLQSSYQGWGWQTRFPHEAGCLDQWPCLPAPKGHSCYRARRTGERRHKSVHSRIADANLSALNLVIVKKRRRKVFLVSLILLCLITWAPKELENP